MQRPLGLRSQGSRGDSFELVPELSGSDCIPFSSGYHCMPFPDFPQAFGPGENDAELSMAKALLPARALGAREMESDPDRSRARRRIRLAAVTWRRHNRGCGPASLRLGNDETERRRPSEGLRGRPLARTTTSRLPYARYVTVARQMADDARFDTLNATAARSGSFAAHSTLPSRTCRRLVERQDHL